MKIISFYMLLLLLITLTIHFSEQIKDINESSSIAACKGTDVDLLWKVDEEKNKISNLEWYFNNKTICSSEPVEDFTVKPPYQGRIERIGKTEIRLKNLSQDDDGIYILHPLFEWSMANNMLKIELRILEPPTSKCTCNIGYPTDFKFEQTESYCGRPQVSFVWKRKQTFEGLGEGNRILNSALQDKEVLCCQDGEAMKCVEDKRQFCTTVSIPHRDNERPLEDGNTQGTDSVTMPGTGTGSTNIHHMQPFVLSVLTVSLLTALLVVALVLALFIRNYKKRKNNMDGDCPSQYSKVNNVSIDTNFLKSILISNTALMAELQASGKDCPSQYSKVNNISIDTDFLKNIHISNTALMAELQASGKDDTDTFKTSESEDASSEPLVHHNCLRVLFPAGLEYIHQEANMDPEDKTTC